MPTSDAIWPRTSFDWHAPTFVIPKGWETCDDCGMLVEPRFLRRCVCLSCIRRSQMRALREAG